ncbi:hypothetical protein GGX14DRAFT_553449 [Mycena pura]|uniref:Uncharacterized protein n=1 Tax=Mycena pura TaxID=153505 RepID=A0AAD6YUC9_9AGAR|nr:hypothetical protein GGX14DRAFT_553449 [Mycena pura]
MAVARPRSTSSCFDRRHIVPYALVAAVPAPIAAALFAVVNGHGQRLATSHVPADKYGKLRTTSGPGTLMSMFQNKHWCEEALGIGLLFPFCDRGSVPA